MEVHAPEHPIRTWRDFLLHIATITVGLLIALGLEAGVESLHHRHIVHQARENIHREIEANRSAAQSNSLSIVKDADNMKENLRKARLLLANPHALDHGEMRFGFSWDSFSDSAWRTARDTGALTYMPIAEVQLYSEVYGQQEIVNREAVGIFTTQAEDVVPLQMQDAAAGIPPQDAHTLMFSTASTYIRLNTLKQLVDQLQPRYQEVLHH